MNASRPVRAAPTSSRPRLDGARVVAFDVIREVTANDAYANLVLPAMVTAGGLAARDAALATELTYGTLRSMGTYDAVLTACVDRPLEALDPRVLDVLRLGAHQLLGTRIAAHAAVDQSVRLVRQAVGPAPAGLVNAVLRKVGGHDLPGWVALLAPDRASDPIGYLALAHAHPRWIVEALAAALAGDLVETEQALLADNERPLVTLAARPGRCEVAELLELGALPGRWSPCAAILPDGAPGALAPVREGRAGVQDEGSQLVALALAAAEVGGGDERWLDMCAGPGGKAALLAGLAAQRGARLLAVELHPHRATLVAGALRTGVVVADGRRPAWRPEAFDRVLIDAPCTGLGALRRRPEARWRRQPADVEALHTLQVQLLTAALESARRDGVVAYVTCSPHLAETVEVVEEVGRSVGVERLDARRYLPESLRDRDDLGPGPDVQLWPHRHGTDAMYLALLRRA